MEDGNENGSGRAARKLQFLSNNDLAASHGGVLAAASRSAEASGYSQWDGKHYTEIAKTKRPDHKLGEAELQRAIFLRPEKKVDCRELLRT